jgi:predicted nucleic acid-binding protein
MSTSDLFFLDSNILIYGHQSLSVFHGQARALLDSGLEGEIVATTP